MVFASLLGGIGLFLLGMMLLSDGLKSFAGDSLRQALIRFTGKPVTAFTSGAIVTALVQSSSATTLTTIGFVSAGLLSFAQAVGLMMGASLGTTSTGWLVSLLGLKFSVSALALPMVGVGAFVRLLGRGRSVYLGLALAGFGLIFVGIDQLQLAMAGLTEHVDFKTLPSGGFLGYLVMMVVGIVLTVLLQSSSAAVAATLTALHAEAIGFEQAASLVIGSAIGTTVTAAIAAIGASTAAKRTALAHVLFNLGTGCVAIVLLPVFLMGLGWLQESFGMDRGAVSLAAFHTAFIFVGVLIFLPFVRPFSRTVEKLIPERGPRLTRHLDPSLLNVPPVAMEAAQNCIRESAQLLMELFDHRLSGQPVDRRITEVSQQIEEAMRELSAFISRIPHTGEGGVIARMGTDSFHALDHVRQLLSPLRQNHGSLQRPSLQPGVQACQRAISIARDTLQQGEPPSDLLETHSTAMAEWRKAERLRLLQASATGTVAAEETLNQLEVIRWMDQITYHTWRILEHLKREE